MNNLDLVTILLQHYLVTTAHVKVWDTLYLSSITLSERMLRQMQLQLKCAAESRSIIRQRSGDQQTQLTRQNYNRETRKSKLESKPDLAT